MATIVLVHGAWQSARTWDYLRPMLEDKQHEVILPILTGLGQDEAHFTESLSLRQHIDDVCRALVAKGAYEVLLVGQDYGGIVITGVAEKMPERIGRLFYLDSLLLEDGQSAQEAGWQLAGENWRLAAGEDLWQEWGVPEGGPREFCRERTTPFARHLLEEALDLPLAARQHLDCCYLASVSASYPGQALYAPAVTRARELGWTVDTIDAGHLPQAEAPRELAEILIRRETPSAHLIL
ncbi:MAG: alpha/beta hydrolase [Bryobacter sp.]|nr:alpha/beta hydrolase [Bryobacter sp.]